MDRIDISNELLGLYHPIAVSLIEILVQKTANYTFKTVPEWLIEVRRIREGKSGSLAAQIGFFDDEIRIVLYPDYCVRGDPSGIIPKGFVTTECHAIYSYVDPAFGIDEIASRLAWTIIEMDTP